MKLYGDFETASELDLGEVGLDNYIKHPSTRVTLFAWAFDDSEVSIWEPLRSQPFPEDVSTQLDNPDCLKCFWNSSFERMVFEHLLGREIPLEQIHDPSIQARHLSMPGKLATVCEIIKLPNALTKAHGKKYIKMFGQPAQMPVTDGLFILPAIFRDHTTHPQEWAEFAEYCRQDVVAMRAADKAMSVYPSHPSVREGWIIDQIINERGVPTDVELAQGASKIDQAAKAEGEARLVRLTGLENPNSNSQMLSWLQARGYPFDFLEKGFVTRVMNGEGKLTQEAKEALEIRKQTSKTAGAKLVRIAQMVSDDGRLRNQFQYLGAARTGRWSGGGTDDSSNVQWQNLTKSTREFDERRELAIKLLRAGNLADLKQHFKNPLEIVGSSIRAAFRAPKGYKFVIADLGSIENRKLGFLARCQAILDVFLQGKDPYLDFGCRLRKIPYEELEAKYKAGDLDAKKLRTNSKPPVLGAGFGLSGGEEKTVDGVKVYSGLLAYARNMGIALTRDEAHEAVLVFRQEYKEVPPFWYDCEAAAVNAIRNPDQEYHVGYLTFLCFGKRMLRVTLPSGRGLHYVRPHVYKERDKRDKERTRIAFETIDQKTHQWCVSHTYSSRLCENFVQASSRDILLNGMLLAEANGVPIVAHVHDELVGLVPEDDSTALDRLIKAMTTNPSWCDMPLAANGFESVEYRKD